MGSPNYEQKQFIGRLARMNKSKDFTMKLSKNYSDSIPRPTKWIDWQDWDYRNRADFTTILPNQVVFDIDAEPYSACCGIAKKIKRKLSLGRIPHTLYSSGGKGIHIEIFLSTKTNGNTDWQKVRLDFAESILRGINYYIDKKKNKMAVDARKYKWSEDTMGSLLRVAGGKKVGYKVPLETIPTTPVLATKPVYPKWINYHWVKGVEKSERPPPPTPRPFNPDNYRELDLCVLEMIEQIQNGEHLSHMQNLAVGGRCFLAGLTTEQVQDIYQHDPKYDPLETAKQYNGISDVLSHHPEKVVSCKRIQESGWCPSKEICRELRIAKTVKGRKV